MEEKFNLILCTPRMFEPADVGGSGLGTTDVEGEADTGCC
jgi:hypothetical protein